MPLAIPASRSLRFLVCSIAAGALICNLHAEPAPAPPPAPTVQGRVFDPTRTPIPGATVAATLEGRTLGQSTNSGQAGEFGLFLQPGTYTVRIAADGFKDSTQTVFVGVAGVAPLEITLEVAPRQEMVTVTESANYQILTPNSTKTATPLRDVPQSISVVPQNLIRDQGMQNMADVVRYVPGITMAQGEGHRDAPIIRGNATTADFYVNGVRDDVQYYRDLYNVERVEAVKGANAITFGRGGGGGVINRVTKEAQFYPIHEISLQGGSFGNKRFATDLGQNINDKLAFRLNGMYENSDSFRHDVNLERYGVAPSVTIKPGDRTQLKLAYEYFNDGRTVDRGIPSFAGAPSAANRSTVFGNPDISYATAGVNLGSVTIEHQLGQLNLRNTTLIGDYDKFYQNLLPGAVNANQTLVGISGYNNATLRRNLFNQTDVTGVVFTGGFRHTILVGTEFGRQRSDNFRNTAFFGDVTSVNVPFGSPRTNVPVAFRQSATDADNFATNRIAGVYVQDQVELSRHVQVVAGARYDYFNIDFHNNRNNDNLSRRDNMVSPRAALIFKPIAPVSVYTSYSVSYLPSSGDQFSSLTATTQTLKPEKFTNYEIGAKWDAARSLSFTTAVYRLDRTNTTARDPNDPSQIVQTGSQRTTGYEIGVNGNLTSRWRTIGGYAYQDAYVTRATTAAVQGAKVALVPHHTFSLWNNYSFTSRLGMGLGVIHQADMFAGIDNTVRLPQFTRADLGAFYTLTEKVRLQANVENLFDRSYYATANGNNNIMPGYARALRMGMIARF
jgi:catecholate siderophore receptor